MVEEIYQQMSIFDDVLPRFQITKPIRLITLFSGIGSQEKALEILKVPFEHYKTCEWAYNSYCAYNSIHLKDTTDYSKDLTKEQLIAKVNGTSINYNEPLTTEQLNKKPIEWLKNAYNNIVATHNLVNIMNVKGQDLEITETDKYDYILTYSFPCQDLSLAGLRKGMSVSQADGGTRSGLLWEVERILAECKELGSLPNVLVMENVPEVCGSKNVRDFEKWQTRLQEFGYSNYCEILNGKDYGIPQNRRRCFMVSILGDYNYTFPKKIPLKIRLKDLLEKEVDEKYYLSEKTLGQISAWNSFENPLDHVLGANSVSPTITTRIAESQDGGINASMKVLSEELPDTTNVRQFGNKALNETLEQNKVEDGDFLDCYNRDNKKDIAGTIQTGVSFRNNVFIAVKNNNSKGYEEAEVGDGIDISSRMESHKGTVQKGTSQTLTCQGGNNVGVVVPNLKEQLCNDLIKQGKVEEGDIVKHSRTKNASKDIDSSITREKEMSALTTRPDTMGIVVQEPQVLGGIGEKKSNGGTQWYEQDRIYADNVATAIPAQSAFHPYYQNNLRIRKLTETECGLLMAFEKKDCKAMKEIGLSAASMYHCFGDSICVNVLMGIFGQMLEKYFNNTDKVIQDYIYNLTTND